MNTYFSRPKNEPYCDSYNSGWSNQSNISWQAQAPKNYAPQFHELYHHAYPQFNDQAVYPPSNSHPPHQQWQSSPYCADFEDNWQPSSQATPSPQSDSDVQAQILKLMGEINQKLTQTVTSLNQTLNSHSESIAKIEAHEEEPSAIYWPPQQQSQQEQYTPQFFAEMQARMDAHFEQIMNHLNREEEELQRQSVANLDGRYMVNESTCYHEQAITTMKNVEVVETHVEEMKEEQIESPQALHLAKGEEVSTEAPSSSTLVLEAPYESRASIAYDLPRGQESSFLGLFEEQKETIKVENFLVYSPHFIPVHDSLPDEKLFENTQKNSPRYAAIWNYLSVGKIYSLWSKRRKDWCFKFKFKVQRAWSASSRVGNF
jgi:hypothetical protein